jgi:hypothetical protein
MDSMRVAGTAHPPLGSFIRRFRAYDSIARMLKALAPVAASVASIAAVWLWLAASFGAVPVLVGFGISGGLLSILIVWALVKI